MYEGPLKLHEVKVKYLRTLKLLTNSVGELWAPEAWQRKTCSSCYFCHPSLLEHSTTVRAQPQLALLGNSSLCLFLVTVLGWTTVPSQETHPLHCPPSTTKSLPLSSLGKLKCVVRAPAPLLCMCRCLCADAHVCRSRDRN